MVQGHLTGPSIAARARVGRPDGSGDTGAKSVDPTNGQGSLSGPSGAGVQLLWVGQVPFGVLLAATGAAMAVLTFSGSIGIGRRIFELLLGVAVLASGALIAAAPALGKRTAGVHLAAGELALAATIVYLGETMPPFHLKAVGHGAALAQFVAVIAGLVLGSVALGLPAPARPGEETSGVHWASVIRDSVILIVGTIIVAIGLTQLANEALMPPKWSWVSFLGITIPGMLILIFLRGTLKALGAPGQLARQFGVEVLLVVGLSVMVFGSVTNLNLGKSGYAVGLKGDGTGLALWVVAAAFLLIVRGGVKFAFPQGARAAAAGVTRKVLYVIGAVALIYGEKSVISGMPPKVTVGAAGPLAAIIIVSGLLILVYVRQAAKVMDPGGPLGPALSGATGRSSVAR